MPTLYFQPHEQAIFGALPAALRAGWTVEKETLEFKDTPEKEDVRFRNITLTDPLMVELRETVASLKTAKALHELVQQTDLTRISKNDLVELLFALGPDAVTAMIVPVLQTTMSRDEMESVAFLCTVRHHLLVSLQPSA